MTTTIKKWHRLKVVGPGCPIWGNFVDSLPDDNAVRKSLYECNARIVKNSSYIEFNNEKDLAMFILKWS